MANFSIITLETYLTGILGGPVHSRLHALFHAGRPSFQDRIAGTAFLCVGFLPIVAERSTVFLLPIVALVAIGLAYIESQRISLRLSALTAVLWLTIGYSILSALWALDPGDVITHVGAAIIALASAQLLASWIGLQSKSRLRVLGFWLVVGFCIGMTYLIVEIASMQGIRRFFLDTFIKPLASTKSYTIDAHGFVRMKDFELNRNIAAANLLLWPTLLCIWRLFGASLRTILAYAVFVSICIVTVLSKHETSKAALLLSAVIFALAYFWPRVAAWSVVVGFVTLVVATIPLSIYAHQSLHLEKADWLQFSAKERIKIWGTLAERVFDAPVHGIGVRSTYSINLEQQAAARTNITPDEASLVPPHAHNVYLQAWFELGAIGALLVMLSGLGLLFFVSKLPADALPFALGALVMGFIEVASSWDIWQRWFFALLALSCVCVVMASRLVPNGMTSRSAQS